VTRVALLVTAALLGGCSDSSGGARDMAGVGTICPGHPEQCQGQCCGKVCTDTKLDIHNCGGCGMLCDKNLVCAGGNCGCLPQGVACGLGQTCCGGAGCKSLDSDIKNCGACGMSCDGTGVKCTSGKCTCGGVACAAGQTCCGGTCMASCPTAPPDMATAGAKLCDCTNTATQCFFSGQCVGPDCCFTEGSFGLCQMGGCTPQAWPPP
jgi:hypothetical protein